MVLGVYGASGLGTEYEWVAEEINKKYHRWEEIVFVDDTPEKIGTTLVGLPVMSFTQAIEKYGMEGIEFIISIGEPAGKDKVFSKLCSCGANVTSLIYPETKVRPGFTQGRGVVIGEASHTPPCSRFGNNVLIQSNAVMGHDLVLGDNVVISSMTFIGGNVTIGKNAYVAPGACIRDRVTIGENAIVGMGSIVTKDVPDNAVVYGNPAKIMRYNESGKVFGK